MIVEFGKVGLVIVPAPETRVHKPVPTVGVLAAIAVVGEEIQIVCDGPASEGVGISFTRIVTVEEVGEQGLFDIVHTKVFNPSPKPVIVVFGEVGFVIVPDPAMIVHKPVPTVGVFADMIVFGEEIQIV